MSILLDALRKSEKRKQLGNTPTIHESSPPAAAEREPLRRDLLALLLVPAFGVMAWFAWHQYAAPQGEGWDLVENPAPVETHTSTGSDSVVKSGPAEPSPASHIDPPPRTPVENLASAESQTVKPVSEQASEAVAESPLAAPSQESRQMESALLAIQEGTTLPSDAADTPETKSDSVRAGDEWSAGEPQPISYWELPESVRSELPGLKVSVLVYANKPADRFILLDGKRQAEGDSYFPGLVVEEIRRDGVVFSYRLYRFLVRR